MSWNEYIPGSTRFEQGEHTAIIQEQSMKSLQSMLTRYEAGLKQFPDGEGNAIFSRLKVEVIEKISSIQSLKKEVKIESTRKRAGEQSRMQRESLRQAIQMEIKQIGAVGNSLGNENYSNEGNSLKDKNEGVPVYAKMNQITPISPIRPQEPRKNVPGFREGFQDGVQKVFSIFR